MLAKADLFRWPWQALLFLNREASGLEARMTKPTMHAMPLRLHRAASIIACSGNAHAEDAQSACAEVAARLVLLEEAILALLRGDAGAEERARSVLIIGLTDQA